MPVTTQISLNPMAQEDFARLDYQVMRQAFASQNQLGRLCDEVIYQNDLAARLEAAGLPALQEVPVTVTPRDFTKILGKAALPPAQPGNGLSTDWADGWNRG